MIGKLGHLSNDHIDSRLAMFGTLIELTEWRRSLMLSVQLVGGPADGARHIVSRLDRPVLVAFGNCKCGKYRPSGRFEGDYPVFHHESLAIDDHTGLPLVVGSGFGRKYTRKVIIIAGKRYLISPLNPQTKKNRGRFCIVLRVVYGKDGADYLGLSVRFEDTGRIGIVATSDVVPARRIAPTRKRRRS